MQSNKALYKTKKMTNKEFLSENRLEIINFYNESVNPYWNASLKEFMTDLMLNFRKVSMVDQFTKTDLSFNLDDAKKRLGLWNKSIVVANDCKTDFLRKKYNGTAYMSMV